MKFIGNVIWVIFGGIEWAILLFLSGVICCCLIVTIPVGLQAFKMAKFVLWPFGKSVDNGKANGIIKKIANFIWCCTFGWISAICFLITGALYCVTIIGIPFGMQYFKLTRFIFLPVGKTFKKA